MRVSIFTLMVRRLTIMTSDEFEHAQTEGYVTINTSDDGIDPLGWWIPTRITIEMLEEAIRQRLPFHINVTNA